MRSSSLLSLALALSLAALVGCSAAATGPDGAGSDAAASGVDRVAPPTDAAPGTDAWLTADVPPATTTGDFRVGERSAVVDYVNSITAADVNRDGRIDLVASTSSSSARQWAVALLGRGDGTFAAAAPTAINYLGTSVSVADFTGDGVLDLALANARGEGGDPTTLAFARGAGDGTFAPPVALDSALAVMAAPSGFVQTDLDGDGHPDLLGSTASLSPAAGRLVEVRSAGDGTFSARAVDLGDVAPRTAFVGDVNNDGHPDAVIDAIDPALVTDRVVVATGGGDGTFRAALSFDIGHARVLSPPADIDGDGQLDVLVGRVNSADNHTSLAVYYGLGDGTFSAPREIVLDAAFDRWGPFLLGDVDGDGRLDVAYGVMRASQSGIAVRHGRSNRELGPEVFTYLVPGIVDVRPYVIADLNGDRAPDMVLGEPGFMTVLLARGGH